MRAVDTNVLVRLIARDDPQQTAAAEIFIAPGAWVSHLVLAELVWVLDSVYQLDAEAQATAVGLLLGHRQLSLQEPEVVQRALTTFRARPALGFSDCLVVEIARKAGHQPVGTLDRGLAKVDGAELIRGR